MYRKFWIDISVPSPSPADTIIERDENDKCIKIDDEYKMVQKRFYVEYDYEIFEKCRNTHPEAIEQYLLNKGKKANIKVFKECRPNFVQQTGILTQFACDKCTDYDFAKAGLKTVTKYIHNCNTKQCRNYRYPMGNQCTCDRCNECLITKYGNMDIYALLKELCCATGGPYPYLMCAEGRCLNRNCAVRKYERLLLFGRGCHTYKLPRTIDKIIDFKRISKFEIDGKDHKFVVYDSLPWRQYITHYLAVLQARVTHAFQKRRQNGERKTVCRADTDGNITLPNYAAFTGIDYIANKKLKLKVTPQGINTQVPAISILVLYECLNVDGAIKDSAHIYVSNQTSHGWYSEIPILTHYYQRLLTELPEFKLNILYGDRGRGDQWNAPFHGYACELANKFGITIQTNTTASGEGKWLCDQIGGTVSKFILYAVKTGSIKFYAGQSIAATIVSYCNENFRTSKTDSINRYFYELKESDVKVHSSPVKSLEIGNSGISDYHCSVVHPGNKLSFRKQSCFCDECISSNFNGDCNQIRYCGKWIPTKLSKYPKYADAVHTPKKKAKNKRKRAAPAALQSPAPKRVCIRVPTSITNNSNRNMNVPPLESTN